jgi:hypothetical protein
MLLRNEFMSLRRVYGGTPVGNESRCETCTHARIIQGYAESEQIVFCNSLWDPIRIPFKVRQCSSYEDKRLPDIEDLEEIAWPMTRPSSGPRAGFVVASKANSARNKEDREKGEPTESPAAKAEEQE